MNKKIFIVAAAGVLLSGCMTRFNVRKVGADDPTKGIHYSLPATFLVGTPKNDGTIDFNTAYLPDPENTYAVDSVSFISKYKMDVTIADGLLKQVTGEQHSDQIPKGLIENGSQTFTDVKKVEKDAADAAEKKRKEVLDAAQKKIDDATKALDTAWSAETEAEDTLAKAEIAAKINPGNAATLAVENAKIDLARAVANRKKAEDDLAAAKAAKAQAASNIPGGNIPKKAALADPNAKNPSAWGPVIYRVVNSKDGVKLVPAEFKVNNKGQIQMATSKKVTSSPTASSVPDLTLHDGNAVVQFPAIGGFGELVIDSDIDFKDIKSAKLMIADGSAEAPHQPMANRNGRRPRFRAAPAARYQENIEGAGTTTARGGSHVGRERRRRHDRGQGPG